MIKAFENQKMLRFRCNKPLAMGQRYVTLGNNALIIHKTDNYGKHDCHAYTKPNNNPIPISPIVRFI